MQFSRCSTQEFWEVIKPLSELWLKRRNHADSLDSTSLSRRFQGRTRQRQGENLTSLAGLVKGFSKRIFQPLARSVFALSQSLNTNAFPAGRVAFIFKLFSPDWIQGTRPRSAAREKYTGAQGSSSMAANEIFLKSFRRRSLHRRKDFNTFRKQKVKIRPTSRVKPLF